MLRDEKRLLVFLIFLIVIIGGGEWAFSKNLENVDAAKLFPLASGNWWEFRGIELSSGVKFRTRLEVGETQVVCGIETKPLIFFKNNVVGYWGPGADLNLAWFLVDFKSVGSDFPDFLFAVGDKRYQRDVNGFRVLGRFESFIYYSSTSPVIPPYIIFSRRLKLGKASYPAQAYYQTADENSDCSQIRPVFRIGIANWELEYSLAHVDTHAYRGKAVRVRFKEDFLDRGWLEDWYFAKDVGLVKIETFSQGQKLIENMPALHRLELTSYFVKTRDGKSKKRR